jgi:hypothetical protein
LPTKGIAAFLRSDHQGRPSLPGVEPRQGRALRELAHGLAAARRGRLDHQLQRAQDAAEQREHQQQRPAPAPTEARAVDPDASKRTV